MNILDRDEDFDEIISNAKKAGASEMLKCLFERDWIDEDYESLIREDMEEFFGG